MTDLVAVQLEYSGVLADMTGRKRETIHVPDDANLLTASIRGHLENKYSLRQPVLILINGKNIISHIKGQSNEPVTAGTCYTLMPVFSGG